MWRLVAVITAVGNGARRLGRISATELSVNQIVNVVPLPTSLSTVSRRRSGHDGITPPQTKAGTFLRLVVKKGSKICAAPRSSCHATVRHPAKDALSLGPSAEGKGATRRHGVEAIDGDAGQRVAKLGHIA